MSSAKTYILEVEKGIGGTNVGLYNSLPKPNPCESKGSKFTDHLFASFFTSSENCGFTHRMMNYDSEEKNI